MGRGKKQSNNHKQHQPKVQEAGAPSQQILQQLLEISEYLKAYKKRLRETEHQFGYLLSNKWLGSWKEYTGYYALCKDENPEEAKGFGRRKPSPKINDDLMAKQDTKFVKVPEVLEEYSYLNSPVDEDYENQKEFIIIDQQLWLQFQEKYPDAICLRRPLRARKSGQPYVDVNLHYFNFLIVDPKLLEKCKSLTEAEYEKIMKRQKKDDTLQKMFPIKKIRVPKIWSQETLENFFKKFIPSSTDVADASKIQLWRMQNYLSFGELRENVLSYFRGVEIGILGNLVENTENDVDDFIKNSYVMLVACGGLELSRLPPPKTPSGYCEECIEDRQLIFTCLCGEVFYCSEKCTHDDKAYHFITCTQAYDSDDDEQYKKKSVYVDSKEVVCGLNNLGNTCYMNSSLQCLINMEWLFEHYSSNKYLKLIPEQEMEENKGVFVNKFSKFVKKVNESEVYSPYSLKSQISYFIAPFKGYSQHDANDFIIYFLNTLNDFTKKQGEEAFGEFILKNLAGKFKSSVTCPECKLTSVTEDVYLQVSLPIKSKVADKEIQYVVVKSWNEHVKGAALASSWEDIAVEIGESKDCRRFVGNEGGELQEIVDMSIEDVYKKHKRETLVFYPNLQPVSHLAEITMNLAYSKVIAGNEMKTVYGYPIISQVDPQMKLWELYLHVAKVTGVSEQGLKQIEDLRNKIQHQIEEERLKYQQEKQKREKEIETATVESTSTEPTDQEAQKALEERAEQEALQAHKANLSQIESRWNEELFHLRSILKFRLSVVTGRKGKKLCNYCHKKCSVCYLPFSVVTSVADFQKLGESDLELDIYLDQKREILDKSSKTSTRNQYTTLAECLEQFSKPELLDEENAWYCQACDMMRLAEKELSIHEYPKTMIIQLKRFKEQNGKKVKNNEIVWYPEILEVPEKSLKYKLSGVVVHQGSLDGGHYWAVCHKQSGYYLFNDSEVKKVPEHFQKNAYILIYERI